jgi:hypothetical protein
MIIQFVTFLEKLVKFLLNVEAVKDITARKRIGAAVLTIYQILIEIEKNAKEIESALHSFSSKKDDDRYSLHAIEYPLRKQREMIYRLEEKLTQCLPQLEIYGEEMSRFLAETLHAKSGLLLFIGGMLIHDDRSSYITLPASLDMSNIASVKSFMEKNGGQIPYNFEQRYYEQNAADYIVIVDTYKTWDRESNKLEARQHLKKLAAEALQYNSSNKIEKARKMLARFIRGNFDIHEMIQP